MIKSKIIVGHALKNDLQVRSAALPDSLRFRSGEPPACLRLAQCAFVYVRLSARACARVFACVRFHAGACAAVCACVFLSLPACVCDMVAVRSSQRTSPTLITTAQANLRTQSMQCNHRCLCTHAQAADWRCSSIRQSVRASVSEWFGSTGPARNESVGAPRAMGPCVCLRASRLRIALD